MLDAHADATGTKAQGTEDEGQAFGFVMMIAKLVIVEHAVTDGERVAVQESRLWQVVWVCWRKITASAEVVLSANGVAPAEGLAGGIIAPCQPITEAQLIFYC